MITVVAPYCPVGRSSSPHLGAARKIESVISILGKLDPAIVLVNTAHESGSPCALTIGATVVAGISVTEVVPPTYRARRYGKFRNLFDVDAVADAVLGMGAPRLAWLYNGYAMESMLGVELRRRTGCKLVQEMEDWHFSRDRGLNPKPFIDWWFWRTSARQADHIFAVNDALARRAGRMNPQVSLFPGVVTDEVALIRSESPPFMASDGVITIGYFGGLSKEKGADRVLAVMKGLPHQYRLLVTGSGPLEAAFRRAASESNGRLEFHGRVSDVALNMLIARCDVLLNLHEPIVEMANGIFPFKVIESIASGRLLISTPLPSNGLEDVLRGVYFSGHDDAHVMNSVLSSREWYFAHKSEVDDGANAAFRRFGIPAILSAVAAALEDKMP